MKNFLSDLAAKTFSFAKTTETFIIPLSSKSKKKMKFCRAIVGGDKNFSFVDFMIYF
jgi:hypothetical protein